MCFEAKIPHGNKKFGVSSFTAAQTRTPSTFPLCNFSRVGAFIPNRRGASVASLQGGQLLAWVGNFLMECRKTRLVH